MKKKNSIVVVQRELRVCPKCHKQVYGHRMTKGWIRHMRQSDKTNFKFSNRLWRCPYCDRNCLEKVVLHES